MREVPDDWMGESVAAEPIAPLLREHSSLRRPLGVKLPLPESASTDAFRESLDLENRELALKANGRIQAFIKYHLVNEQENGNVPFGGRGEDLDRLDSWLDDTSGEPRYLLTAPTGRGKSALLVHWLQRLKHAARLSDDRDRGWHVVFLPISVTFETHQPEDFFAALAVRLAAILDKRLPQTREGTAVRYADHCQRLAEELGASGRRTLIIIDGIDEALADSFQVWWFPRVPAKALRLVLSARWKGDDRDSSGWRRRLNWEHPVRVRSRELPLISVNGVRDILLGQGAPKDVIASRPEIISRLHELSEGEPLVLKYYVEALWSNSPQKTHLTIDELNELQPGFGSFFHRSLAEQERLWKESGRLLVRENVDAILAVLACAHGVVKNEDLLALLETSGLALKGGCLAEEIEPQSGAKGTTIKLLDTFSVIQSSLFTSARTTSMAFLYGAQKTHLFGGGGLRLRALMTVRCSKRLFPAICSNTTIPDTRAGRNGTRGIRTIAL
jgi:hypothetical protein